MSIDDGANPRSSEDESPSEGGGSSSETEAEEPEAAADGSFTSVREEPYKGSSSNPVRITIYAERSASAAKPTSTAYDLTSRVRTAANVSWSPPVSTEVGEELLTPDLSGLVQEVVSQADWTAGGSLCALPAKPHT